MDPVSQAAVGAAFAATFAPPRRTAAAVALGALAGMAADLDVLIHSAEDPLLFLEVHRQFTHAFAFIPFGALLCAVVLHPLLGRGLRFRQSYGFCLLGYATHGLLDACTSYGTQLWWPFSDVRIAWNLISIVDPLFTLPMVALTAAAALRRAPTLARWAIGWGLLVFGIGAVQGQRAQAAAADIAQRRGHAVERLEAKPSFGNLLVWKVLYESDGAYYVDAVRLGRTTRHYPGTSVPALQLPRDLPWLDGDGVQARDIGRFRWFSDDFIALDPTDPTRVIDVRYSMVPNEIVPLWGLQLDRDRGDAGRVAFFHDRRPRPEQRAALMRMLTGH